MIRAARAVPRRAASVTVLVLAAALLRSILLPLGDLVSTVGFAGLLLVIVVSTRSRASEPRWGRGKAVLAGLAVGAVLLLPAAGSPLSGRPLAGFWIWAAIAAVVATLEESAIRGTLYRTWSEEAGPGAAIVLGAIVFAAIHLPRYGLAAMPLDCAVGLALGGLRALTGRVMPCAIAHTVADWAAWFTG
jgi:membrane protease YdiL (CAAX protease family)